nr:MAG TPA: attachment glycoprotein [Crassvirales sp.]
MSANSSLAMILLTSSNIILASCVLISAKGT